MIVRIVTIRFNSIFIFLAELSWVELSWNRKKSNFQFFSALNKKPLGADVHRLKVSRKEVFSRCKNSCPGTFLPRCKSYCPGAKVLAEVLKSLSRCKSYCPGVKVIAEVYSSFRVVQVVAQVLNCSQSAQFHTQLKNYIRMSSNKKNNLINLSSHFPIVN
jgi:hypothetical protein